VELDWLWSSYRGYLDGLDGPSWLRSRSVLGWLGSIGARQQYRRYVKFDREPTANEINGLVETKFAGPRQLEGDSF
jgi:hypothetical protein